MKARYRRIGCFLDKSRRDLVISLGNDYKLTVEKCGGLCKRKGYQYFGLQYGYQCYCGNHYGRYGKRPNTECAYKCRGDSSQYCGGAYRSDVYSTGLKGEPITHFSYAPALAVLLGPSRLSILIISLP